MAMVPSPSPSPAPAFHHNPLLDNATHIRLLEVVDINHSEEINVKCKLTAWPVDSAPSYHAISYTWGDPDLTTTIIVNDQQMKVRQNCEYVLKQAHWHGGSSRYYWIDAICIDQGNLEEKGSQVVMMGGIYRKAAHVLACVGRHADDSDFLYGTLAAHEKTWVSISTAVVEFTEWWEDERVTLMIQRMRRALGPPNIRRLLRAMGALARRPYFSRLWILQELYHGSAVSFLCGGDHIPCSLLLRLFRLRHCWSFWFPYSLDDCFGPEGKSGPGSLCLSNTDMILLVARQSPIGSKTLVTLSRNAARLLCEDPRDKVYGIVSMVDWASFDVDPIIPDYTKTAFVVAMDFLQKLAEFQMRSTPGFDGNLLHTGMIMVRNLALTAESDGLCGAIKARQEPLLLGKEEQLPPIGSNGPSVRVKQEYCWGGQISQQDIDDSFQALFRSDPTGGDDSKVLLPRHTQPDDWLLRVDRHLGLVAREGLQGKYSIIGKAIIDTDKYPWHGDKPFHIFIDVEDVVVLFGVRPENEDFASQSDTWRREYVDTRVCRAPESSYAILDDELPGIQ
ncbi:hypothetical protein VMCG_06966 [Cytospora schulzeri]|uniref:Heterokaryon incompatibility domain-containing protein n=1 Tax=Cytospora schulzeri TaxID=448051 RepID=A0A423W436_9PEZI|nr:hypothetical protein VMCG_06966 [Valsa malicola]